MKPAKKGPTMRKIHAGSATNIWKNQKSELRRQFVSLSCQAFRDQRYQYIEVTRLTMPHTKPKMNIMT